MSNSSGIHNRGKSSLILFGILVLGLSGCNSGSSSTPSSGNYTQYNLQNYELSVTQSSNCTLEANSTLSCNSNGTFGGVYRVTFNTPLGVPGAYLLMPSAPQYGVTISGASGGCPQTAPESGVTYVCNFTMAANGTAAAGNIIYLPVTGVLGNANVVTIKLN